jgi:hypothetical protein
MYDWSQNFQTVTFSIPLAYKIDSKKIDSTITINYVKLNIPDMKLFKLVDLYDTIIIESSKIIIENNKIIFHLTKETEKKWPDLEYKASKEELKSRRKLAEDDYHERVKSMRDMASSKKKEYEKFVIDKSIQIEDEKRKELTDKKTQEKSDVEKDLYSFVDKIENRHNYEEDKIEIKTDDKSKLFEIIKNNEDRGIEVDSDDRFVNEHKIKQEAKITPETPQSAIRQPAKINVNLTEKKIAHFAARESLSKEPPYPKSKKYVPEKNYVRFYINQY